MHSARQTFTKRQFHGKLLRDGREEVEPMKRDLYQSREYAGRRAVLALDRASVLATEGKGEDKDKAFRWMRLWLAFAAPRHATVVVRKKRSA
jgi:hypothetical protein